MLERVVAAVVERCCRFPWVTVLVAALLAAAGIAYTAENFAISTDTSQLISPKLPWRQRELQLDAAFPQQVDTLLVVVDGATPELAAMAARELAAALAAKHEHIQSVEETDAGPFFEQNGLLFLSKQDVQHTTDQLIRAQAFLGTLAADPSLRGLADALGFIPEGVKLGSVQLKNFAGPLQRLSGTIDALLKGEPASFSWSELMTGEKPKPRDLRRFIQVKPILDYDALEPGAAASDTIRDTARALGLTPDKGVTVRLTGPVAMADEEFATVADGALLNSLLTAAAVLVILWFALGSKRLILAVMLNLLVGLALTAAVGLALVGVLNLISVAFAVLFVGIGVDFGIQVAVRYRRERHLHDDLLGSLQRAAHAIAKPLVLAAAATAAGFYAFLPTAYQGVSELGLIAGTGMMIAFLTSITLLPALIVLFRPRAEPEPIGYAKLEPVDRFMARNRKPILVGTAVLVAAGLPLFAHLHFDFNPLNLRSAKVESVATLRDLMQDVDTTPNAITVLTPSLDDANAIAEKLAKLPEVSGTLSLQNFVPKDQDAKLAIIADAASLLGPTLDTPDVKPGPTDAETVDALKSSAVAFAALGARGDATTAAMAKSLQGVADADPSKRASIGAALLSGLRFSLEQIRASLHPEHVSLANLPTALLDDWMAKDGQVRVEVRPRGDQNDNDAMAHFAKVVRKIAPEATGTPILIQESADTIVRAFAEAAALALASITIILFVALRRISDVLVTLLPLLLAGVVTLELTVIFGLKLNFANIIALPLLLGVGVAFKIYYVLAWRKGETSPLASSLTRAVLFSAATTATAFVSLWLSNHPGTSSMGKLLTLSLVTTLCAAVLFQPILMGPPRQVRGSATRPERREAPSNRKSKRRARKPARKRQQQST